MALYRGNCLRLRHLSLLSSLMYFNRACSKLLKLSSNDKPHKFLDKLLPMLSMFSTWAQKNNRFLFHRELNEKLDCDAIKPSVFENQDGKNLKGWKEKYSSDQELSRLESRSRSTMKSALTLVSEIIPISRKECEDEGVLREFAEIRGYLPFGDTLEV